MNSLTLLTITFSTILFLLIFCIFILSKKLIKTTENLNSEKLLNNNLLSLNDTIRCFKHDFDNIMQSIGGYIFSEDMYGLKTYYSKLSNDFIEYKNLSYLNPKTINNPAIYALISSKFNKASDLKISFKLETFLDFNTLKISIYDFCKILGILLDNAIEASMECENKIINLIIRYDKRNNIQLLHIENSYLNSNLDCSKIFEKNFTTKPHNTGLRFMGNQKNNRKKQKFEFNYRDK